MSGAAYTLACESPRQPEVQALIDALDAYQVPLYPIESHHGIDLEALCAADIHFLVARDAQGAAVACGAVRLAPIDGHPAGELKRMFVSPAQRGQGLGRRLLNALAAWAQSQGARRLYLETGCRQPEAITLYERAGFAHVPAFGDYAPDPLSVFMMKELP
ncbi:putative acetyltransferase [Inhella inkyongensis]|uniref:Putative acetyltransferase n=1 Tax=Inhella inkyongensis TaxID=392593 RepID=A0A840S2N7_9BURK|nr:GNAT family N-acetyltransferase [Inhella inkyongensis]MBB5203346.1 putative acetyltransferase [Inhella inkyongensis]